MNLLRNKAEWGNEIRPSGKIFFTCSAEVSLFLQPKIGPFITATIQENHRDLLAIFNDLLCRIFTTRTTSVGTDQSSLNNDTFSAFIKSFFKGLNLDIWVFNSKELFDKMIHGHTRIPPEWCCRRLYSTGNFVCLFVFLQKN